MSDEELVTSKNISEISLEEYYFSQSQNKWIMVSDMTDSHIRRAFKRLLKMIRLGQLITLSDYKGSDDDISFLKKELSCIETHTKNIKDKLND